MISNDGAYLSQEYANYVNCFHMKMTMFKQWALHSIYVKGFDLVL